MNAEDIPGATMASYTPVAADDGKHLRVSVGYDDGYDDGNEEDSTATSALTSNRPPSFAMAATSRDVAENSAADTAVGELVVAADPDNDDLTYALSGADATDFSIDNNGQIAVDQGTMLDYETRTSYIVTVTATDPDGETATIEVTINVTNVGLDTPYDVDDSGEIGESEMRVAVADFFADPPQLTTEEMRKLVGIYFSTS